MRKAIAVGTWMSVAALLLLGCDRTTAPTVRTKIHFLNGPTVFTAGSVAPPLAPPGPAKSTAPSDGLWLLTPSRVTLTLRTIQFGGGVSGNDGASAAAVDCSVMYDATKASLAPLSECDFSVHPGTYNTLSLGFSDSMIVVINDTINNFYSSPTGVYDTIPSGGAQTMIVTGLSSALIGVRLPANLVVSDSATTIAASVVINALQSFRVTMFNGVVSIGWIGVSAAKRPDMIASIGTPTAIEYYVAQSIGSVGGYCAGGSCVHPPTGVAAVGIYYTGPPTTAVGAEMTLNGAPTACSPIGVPIVSDARGYTGLDATGSLGWAVSTDATWSTYSAEFRMARGTTVGSTTTMYCKARSTDPAPAGGSYASGAPSIASAGNSLGTFVLVGK